MKVNNFSIVTTWKKEKFDIESLLYKYINIIISLINFHGYSSIEDVRILG